MKYIQSFYQYPVTFSSIQKTIPARGAQGDLKNIAEIKESELEILETREPFFRELVNNKKIRVLNHLPENYKSSAIRINEANDEIARLKEENEKLKKLTEKTETATEENAETEKKESSVKTETATEESKKKTKKKK